MTEHNVELPVRRGARPRTTDCAPHSQIDQLPDEETQNRLGAILVETIAALPHVATGPSRRAPPGTAGFYLDPSKACANERCFLLGSEFAHVHVSDDGSLHAILPEPLRAEAMAKGWAEPHPLAGRPTVSPDTVMLYAPRDDGEAAVIAALVRRSWLNAQGLS